MLGFAKMFSQLWRVDVYRADVIEYLRLLWVME